MLKIRLSPRGKKHQITYRIVVAKAKSKLNGQYIDDLGFYTPQTKTLKIDQKKLESWQKNGAQIALGLNRLLDPKKFPPKPKKIKKEEKPTETKTEEKKEKEEEIKN